MIITLMSKYVDKNEQNYNANHLSLAKLIETMKYIFPSYDFYQHNNCFYILFCFDQWTLFI